MFHDQPVAALYRCVRSIILRLSHPSSAPRPPHQPRERRCRHHHDADHGTRRGRAYVGRRTRHAHRCHGHPAGACEAACGPGLDLTPGAAVLHVGGHDQVQKPARVLQPSISLSHASACVARSAGQAFFSVSTLSRLCRRCWAARLTAASCSQTPATRSRCSSSRSRTP